MKRIRIPYYSSMLILLLAGLATGRREYFFVLCIMLLVICYAAALNIWTFLSFSFVQELSHDTVVNGAAPVFRVGIYNDKPFPFTMMKIVVQTPSPSERVELLFNLEPNSNIYYDIPLKCAYRGVYDIGMTTIEINDAFGLLRMRFDLRSLPYYRHKKLIIYPRLVQLPYLPAQLRDAKYTGGGAQRISEEGESFSDTRQYRFGDPFKRVHRTLSMRRRELFVKRYDVPMETAAIIALDTAANEYEGEQLLHYADIASECAAAIAHYSLRAGYVVSLTSADESRPAVEGKSSLDFPGLYDELAVVPFNAVGDICATLLGETQKHTNLRTVYIITTRRDQPILDTLRRISQSGCSVKYLSPAPAKQQTDDKLNLPAGVSGAFISDSESIPRVMGELI